MNRTTVTGSQLCVDSSAVCVLTFNVTFVVLAVMKSSPFAYTYVLPTTFVAVHAEAFSYPLVQS